MARPKLHQARGAAETPARPAFFLPFVAREKEVARLCELHAQHKHVLILGPAGVGKSALVERVRERLSLFVSPESVHFGEICDSLEPQLRLRGEGVKLLQRKRQLRTALSECGRPVVFDGVGWTGPKVSSFFESVAQRVPVWICTRSEHPWDIGHFWPLLVRYERVELRSFHLNVTRALIEAAVKAAILPSEAENIAEWLHRKAAGSPFALRGLLEELASGRYDLGNPRALQRLNLDRRIHEIFPLSNIGAIPSGGDLL